MKKVFACAKCIKEIISLMLLIFLSQVNYGQQCETFDKSLFHMLPESVPETINCVDTNGLKQGWWIFYEVKQKQEGLKNRSIVMEYSYGQYRNNSKIGTWKSVNNFHSVYVNRIDHFYRGSDSTLIISKYADGGWHKSETFINADSSIIQYTHLHPDGEYPVKINCDQSLLNDQECQLTYRGKKLKSFPMKDFEYQKQAILYSKYSRTRRAIDESK